MDNGFKLWAKEMFGLRPTPGPENFEKMHQGDRALIDALKAQGYEVSFKLSGPTDFWSYWWNVQVKLPAQ